MIKINKINCFRRKRYNIEIIIYNIDLNKLTSIFEVNYRFNFQTAK